MTVTADPVPVLAMTDGVRFGTPRESWFVPPVRVFRGAWTAFVPEAADSTYDPSGFLAWTLATMRPPQRGRVELLGHDVYQLDYESLLGLRARMGFVHGYGGLLSNLTIRENIALPVKTHRNLGGREEAEVVDRVIRCLTLEKIVDLKPHQMDVSSRWRACVARALVLEPEWVVLEGIGNWEMDHGRGTEWRHIVETAQRGGTAMAVCLARPNPEFESWFMAHRGTVVRFTRREYLHDGRETH